MLGDCLLVFTPCNCTCSGNCAMASDTRFCTSTWAMFKSVPSSNVTVSVYEPSLVHWLDMYIIFSTPFTCCSIGAATLSATTSAFAPG